MSEISGSAEAFVCFWLEERGWTILERNYRTRRSEVDIIAADGGTTAFVEVKFARDGRATATLEKIDADKRSRIVHGAMTYLSSNPPVGQVRFDVAIVRGTPERMRMGEYLADAFRPDLD